MTGGFINSSVYGKYITPDANYTSSECIDSKVPDVRLKSSIVNMT